MELITEINIKNSPAEVWAVLSDFELYGVWNPFVKQVKGKVEVGSKIEVLITPPDANPMTFKPLVLNFDENKQFRWLGNLLFKGLFDGEHRFELIAQPDGTTRFIHAEKFSGILVPFLKKMLENNTKRGFEAMNEALKDRVEGRP
jgi:hypothetical protein